MCKAPQRDRSFILNSKGSVFRAKLQVYYIQQATDSVYSKNTIMLSPISLNSGSESGALITAAKNIEC